MLWFTLALRMGSTVRNLKTTMSNDEFATWVIYDSLQPIGDIRSDLNAARISQTVYSSAGGKDATLKDFVNFNRKTKQEYKLEKLTPLEREIATAFQKASN